VLFALWPFDILRRLEDITSPTIWCNCRLHIIVETRCIVQNNYCLVKKIALIAVSHLRYPVSSPTGGYQNSGRKINLKY
jgi:hypothetical protein